MEEHVVERPGLPAPSWTVLVVRLPAEPARYRMAVWRELRRSGAVLVGSSAWAIPDVPAARPVVAQVRELTSRAAGTLVALRATGFDAVDVDALAERFHAARRDEWDEFGSDCDKYLAELEKEERLGKFTLAELEEEEQGLERMRRWYRDLRARDLINSPGVQESTARLQECEVRFDRYAERVYAALSAPVDPG